MEGGGGKTIQGSRERRQYKVPENGANILSWNCTLPPEASHTTFNTSLCYVMGIDLININRH